MADFQLKKGELAEEKLRLYFLSLGYFVVRSIKARYQGFDVTDVDLFLYSRPSPISRERTNVDVKMKQKPQALERIFWTKGLQEVLGFEKCIVATTDKRSHISDFGIKNNVLVLDGNFMSKLDSTDRYGNDRLHEEELCELINRLPKYSKNDWKKSYETSKSNLIEKLNFDGLNDLLIVIRSIFEELYTSNEKSTLNRLLFCMISFLMITIDYSMKDVSYKDQQERIKLIANGIRFGEMGEKKAEEIISMSSALMSSFLNKSDHDVNSIKSEVYSHFSNIHSEIIAEYIGNTKMMKRILPLAIEFENAAFKREPISILNLNPEQQSIIGLLCDFHSIDRKKILM